MRQLIVVFVATLAMAVPASANDFATAIKKQDQVLKSETEQTRVNMMRTQLQERAAGLMLRVMKEAEASGLKMSRKFTPEDGERVIGLYRKDENLLLISDVRRGEQHPIFVPYGLQPIGLRSQMIWSKDDKRCLWNMSVYRGHLSQAQLELDDAYYSCEEYLSGASDDDAYRKVKAAVIERFSRPQQ